jgi:hypothetical protein
MARRYHAMLFPVGPALAEVEALRRAWDPAMAARFAAHVTLVYPDEHAGVEALRTRMQLLAERRMAFDIRLATFGRSRRPRRAAST